MQRGSVLNLIRNGRLANALQRIVVVATKKRGLQVRGEKRDAMKASRAYANGSVAQLRRRPRHSDSHRAARRKLVTIFVV